MLAGTDLSLNTTYSWALGADPFVPMAYDEAIPYIQPILEPGFAPYANFYGANASLYSAPVLIPTAAVGVNPWDHIFGGIDAWGSSIVPGGPALALAPQTGVASMA